MENKDHIPEGQAGRHIGKVKSASLTGFLCRLTAMTDTEVVAADPRRAVKTFAIRLDYAIGYIQLERKQRGLPPLEAPAAKE